MTKKLYVGNIPHKMNDNELHELFQQYGSVESAQIIVDKMTNRSKGFGFVTMENAEDADSAIKALHEQECGGRKIIVNEARPPQSRDNRRDGYRDNRGQDNRSRDNRSGQRSRY